MILPILLLSLLIVELPVHDLSFIPSITPVISLCKQPGMFALTYDGGPSINTGGVLDAFDARKLKATFHPVVDFLQEVTIAANIQRAASSGHLVGLSLENNIDLSVMSNGTIFSTIESRANILQSYIGYKPRFLRLPNYQNMNNGQLEFIISQGYTITTYNLDSYDYVYNSSIAILGSFEKVLDTLSQNTKGAFISVQRDSSFASVNATGSILDYLLSKGYNIVTLDICTGIASNASTDNITTLNTTFTNGTTIKAPTVDNSSNINPPVNNISSSSSNLLGVHSPLLFIFTVALTFLVD